MTTQRMIKTHGDPIGTVRQLVKELWLEADLAGVLAPVSSDEKSMVKPRLVENPQSIDDINPFKPVMTMNTARLVPELMKNNPDVHYGALLRPCEMRALIEMTKHDSFSLDNFLTICVDCLGTMPLEDYKWHARRKQSSVSMDQESLQFARQGGILAYRDRSACQTCATPEAQSADVNIHVFGLPVRRSILIETRDIGVAQKLETSSLSIDLADPDLVHQHERVVSRLKERHQRTIDRLNQSLSDILPQNIEGVITQLESCGACQACMEVCPVCAVDFPRRNTENRYQSNDIKRWLISCAGCGMCEQACVNHVPLNTIFKHIQDQLAQEFGYSPGRFASEPLPIH